MDISVVGPCCRNGPCCIQGGRISRPPQPLEGEREGEEASGSSESEIKMRKD